MEHIGSTAIAGCWGKGIIDLLVLYQPGDLESARAALDRIEFQRQSGPEPFPESRPMRVGNVEYLGRMHRVHAHVVESGVDEARDLIRFRDILRVNISLRRAYETEKRAILARGITKSTEYSKAKGALYSQRAGRFSLLDTCPANGCFHVLSGDSARNRAVRGASLENQPWFCLYIGTVLFAKLGLSPKVIEGVSAAGYTEPTPIQLRAIPLILDGPRSDRLRPNRHGKTAAFALPIISRLGQRGKLRALVLEPTRELAAQVETAIRDYARFTDLRTVVLFGGTGYGRQDQALRQGLDIVVATPGRLLDQLQRRMLQLDQIEILVLDEADRMLDMGFMPDVRKIVERCPRNRQTMLFSATIPPEIEQLSRWALRNPETIEIGQRRSPAARR